MVGATIIIAMLPCDVLPNAKEIEHMATMSSPAKMRLCVTPGNIAKPNCRTISRANSAIIEITIFTLAPPS